MLLRKNTQGGQLPSEDEVRFEPGCYSLCTSTGTADKKNVSWAVTIRPNGHMIARNISYGGEAWDRAREGWEPEGIIWPTWPTRSEDEVASTAAPLAEIQHYWATVGDRLRDSAKWMAIVLGAVLGTIAGTSPLAGIRQHHLPGMVIFLGLAGLGFLGLTLFLVLQVMRPQSVSYTDVQFAKPGPGPFRKPLDKWREIVESQEDLYLPCGVKCLTSLRQSMIVEEITLMALAQARGSAQDEPSSRKLCEAQTARAARLLELRTAAARIATVGEYYKLKARSTRATYGGVLAGLIGTAAVVAAFAWPLS